ncbi:protein translocase subunit SecF [Solirhodobacter olei]|uniref:protein translocase subunit SecF n=1 Tax=Solirhodobacter olei TaxID=2493082 RepID=UPI000FDCCC26|nr:protein translocase subunit SecF [Solirhodobacter olei]
MRHLRMVPDHTNIDFFAIARVTFGGSMLLVVISIMAPFIWGLNFGIDFLGGTTIRTEASQPVNVGAYRKALDPLHLGDVIINQVFDPSASTNKHVANVRVSAEKGHESIPPAALKRIEGALQKVDPSIRFTSVNSVGPKVSGELMRKAVMAISGAVFAVMAYIWLRFEWQFALGAAVATVHDVALTVGIFVLLQIKFDLSIIAALLTIVGYSLNDTVVVFDRARENLIKYKKMPLRDVLNLSANETLSRTLMTSLSTMIPLIALLIFGGDVIRGFVFAIAWGVITGTYSSIYVAKNIVLMLGVKRDWGKKDDGAAGTQFAAKG